MVVQETQSNEIPALAIHVKDSDIRHVRALIIGPPDTPYEFGFFEVGRVLGGIDFALTLVLVQNQIRSW